MNGRGFSFQVSIQELMAASSSLVERCVPRRSHLFVNSANHRSTKFIHDEYVGVKWRWNLGWRARQRWISGVLWVETLSRNSDVGISRLIPTTRLFVSRHGIP